MGEFPSSILRLLDVVAVAVVVAVVAVVDVWCFPLYLRRSLPDSSLSDPP